MKKFKKVSGSMIVAGALVLATSIPALALTINDSDRHGFANFGLKSSGGYYFEYCYYYQDNTRHWAEARYDGRTSGIEDGDPGENASANSPSSSWAYREEYRDWGKY